MNPETLPATPINAPIHSVWCSCHLCTEWVEAQPANKPSPVRPTQRFIDAVGHTWEVLRTLPGGKVDMIDRSRSRFGMFSTADVREMTRENSGYHCSECEVRGVTCPVCL